mmetsp:Transcript_41846/g.75999  ORF Transcript_41846/g.75999 Transcript_41846/m.75999 type:complete len:299 (+) Transcript_41846:79-975(+)
MHGRQSGKRGEEHIVLLGDSTLDNARYLNPSKGDLSIERQLLEVAARRRWQVTVLAQDGSTLEDVRKYQLPVVPESATHLVLSVSGNDLLGLLNDMVEANFTAGAVYQAVGSGMTAVIAEYRQLLLDLKAYGCHTALCTVYRPNFNHLFFKSLAGACLTLHNSRLRALASEFALSIIDLAVLCSGKEDFANPLELSTLGGAKVVWNIAAFLIDHALPKVCVDDEKNAAHSTEVIIFAYDAPQVHAHCCRSSAGAKVYKNANPTAVLPGADVDPTQSDLPREGRPRMPFSEAQRPWRQT